MFALAAASLLVGGHATNAETIVLKFPTEGEASFFNQGSGDQKFGEKTKQILELSDRHMKDFVASLSKQFIETTRSADVPIVNLHIPEKAGSDYQQVLNNLVATSEKLDIALAKASKLSKNFLQTQAITKSMKNYEDIARIFRDHAASATPKSFSGSSLLKARLQNGDEPRVNVVLQNSNQIEDIEQMLLKLKAKEEQRLTSLLSIHQ